MSLFLMLFGIALAFVFVALLFFVLFGQMTVRKLRKNPATKEALGMEFVSGWDIINVATALSIPKRFSRKLRTSPLAALYADADLLERHTTRFDRILARIFFALWLSSSFSMIILMLLNKFGILK